MMKLFINIISNHNFMGINCWFWIAMFFIALIIILMNIVLWNLKPRQ